MEEFKIIDKFRELEHCFYIYGKFREGVIEERFIVLKLENQNSLILDGDKLLDAAYKKYHSGKQKEGWLKNYTYFVFLVENEVNKKRILEKESNQLFFKKYVIDKYNEKLKSEKSLEKVLKNYIPCLAPLEELIDQNERIISDIFYIVTEKLKSEEYNRLNKAIEGDISKLKDLKINNIFNGDDDCET